MNNSYTAWLATESEGRPTHLMCADRPDLNHSYWEDRLLAGLCGVVQCDTKCLLTKTGGNEILKNKLRFGGNWVKKIIGTSCKTANQCLYGLKTAIFAYEPVIATSHVTVNAVSAFEPWLKTQSVMFKDMHQQYPQRPHEVTMQLKTL
ncbi:hypothetical protein CEXT_343841 [Caerostris extrusa]|uniref:Uncharacterized protein n=1 Tax=Caerostris extrusa TaxID=172846 RepID=A0AAV4UUS9_CAEEX|nr:hypothetical protein CEXT_343841 [Caerostris extrusa]